jgi:ATP diphosphatase
MPALARALKLQQKAGKVGFDWNDAKTVLAKIREEADEIALEIASRDNKKAAAEVGDLLFAVVNLARHLDVDPEAAVRATNIKFERRFAAIENALAKQGKRPQDSSLAEMDALWNAAKAVETLDRPARSKAAKTPSRQSRRRSHSAKRRAVHGSR